MAWNDENLQPSVTNSEDAALVALGQRGATAKTTGLLTGNFAAIQVVTATTFDNLTALNSNFSDLLGVSLPAGTIIYGPFTAVGATSGLYVAYKA